VVIRFQIRLSSGELRLVRSGMHATVGAVSNLTTPTRYFGKAGPHASQGYPPSVNVVLL